MSKRWVLAGLMAVGGGIGAGTAHAGTLPPISAEVAPVLTRSPVDGSVTAHLRIRCAEASDRWYVQLVVFDPEASAFGVLTVGKLAGENPEELALDFGNCGPNTQSISAPIQFFGGVPTGALQYELVDGGTCPNPDTFCEPLPYESGTVTIRP